MPKIEQAAIYYWASQNRRDMCREEEGINQVDIRTEEIQVQSYSTYRQVLRQEGNKGMTNGVNGISKKAGISN